MLYGEIRLCMVYGDDTRELDKMVKMDYGRLVEVATHLDTVVQLEEKWMRSSRKRNGYTYEE
ncbi:hypothetical protein CsSME_00031569 [Camellia sinensis var. sinensis]